MYSEIDFGLLTYIIILIVCLLLFMLILIRFLFWRFYSANDFVVVHPMIKLQQKGVVR